MLRGEIVVRGSAVEYSIENCLADEFRGNWVGTLSRETVVVVVVVVGCGGGGVFFVALGNINMYWLRRRGGRVG